MCSNYKLKMDTFNYMFDRKIPYNELPKLPPLKEFLDTEILLKWGLASRSLAELNKNVFRIPNPSMLVNTIALQEAQSSSAIENIFTTADELYKAISDTVNEETANPATKEVLFYREALWSGYNKLMEQKFIDKSTIVSIFQKIKQTNQGFRSPQSQVIIKRGNSDFRSGETVYTPPRGAGIIDEKMDNLLEFMSDQNGLDPLLKMTIAHYQFEAIHPFIDGNGRTGRILNLLYLIEQNLLSHPVLYLSKYIIENKDDYYHLLSGVTQRQDWKSWVLFMLNAVDETSKHTNTKIDEILSQMDATFEYVKPKLKWYSLELNQALFSQPYVKQSLIGKMTNAKSRTTVTNYMSKLVEYGVLSTKVDGREVYFVNNDLIRILG